MARTSDNRWVALSESALRRVPVVPIRSQRVMDNQFGVRGSGSRMWFAVATRAVLVLGSPPYSLRHMVSRVPAPAAWRSFSPDTISRMMYGLSVVTMSEPDEFWRR